MTYYNSTWICNKRKLSKLCHLNSAVVFSSLTSVCSSLSLCLCSPVRLASVRRERRSNGPAVHPPIREPTSRRLNLSPAKPTVLWVFFPLPFLCRYFPVLSPYRCTPLSWHQSHLPPLLLFWFEQTHFLPLFSPLPCRFWSGGGFSLLAVATQ